MFNKVVRLLDLPETPGRPLAQTLVVTKIYCIHMIWLSCWVRTFNSQCDFKTYWIHFQQHAMVLFLVPAANEAVWDIYTGLTWLCLWSWPELLNCVEWYKHFGTRVAYIYNTSLFQVLYLLQEGQVLQICESGRRGLLWTMLSETVPAAKCYWALYGQLCVCMLYSYRYLYAEYKCKIVYKHSVCVCWLYLTFS